METQPAASRRAQIRFSSDHIAPFTVVPAEIKLEKEGPSTLIKWRYPDTWPDEEERRAGETDGALQAFVRLARATNDEAFVDFANKYGALHYMADAEWQTDEDGKQRYWYTGHLDYWKLFARQVRAFRSIAKALGSDAKLDQETDPKDWWIVFFRPSCAHDAMVANQIPPRDYEWSGHEAIMRHEQGERAVLMRRVNEWLEDCPVQPLMKWGNERKTLPGLHMAPYSQEYLSQRLQRAHDALQTLRSWLMDAKYSRNDALATMILGPDRKPDGYYIGDDPLACIEELIFTKLPDALFALLGLQLVAELTRADFMARCDVCGEVFDRVQLKGKFCSEECRNERHREHERNSARKRRAEQRAMSK